jgi:hypothetical protein
MTPFKRKKRLLGTEGTTFDTVNIGDQVWMTKNFIGGEVGSKGSYSPSWDTSIYGDQYTFSQAISNAPNGWHLPTVEEWKMLGYKILQTGNARKIMAKQFRLVFYEGHAYFWTSTIIRQGSKTRCYFAEMTKYNFDLGNFEFEMHDRSDMYLYPARYIQDHE